MNNDDRIESPRWQLHDRLNARWSKLTYDGMGVADGATEYLDELYYGLGSVEANPQIEEPARNESSEDADPSN